MDRRLSIVTGISLCFASPVLGQDGLALGVLRADGALAPQLVLSSGAWRGIDSAQVAELGQTWHLLGPEAEGLVLTSGQPKHSTDELGELVLTSSYPPDPSRPWRPDRIAIVASESVVSRRLEAQESPPKALLDLVVEDLETKVAAASGSEPCGGLAPFAGLPIRSVIVETWYSVTLGASRLHRVSVLLSPATRPNPGERGCGHLIPVWAGWVTETGAGVQLQVEEARLSEPHDPKDRGVLHLRAVLEHDGRILVYGERTSYGTIDVSLHELSRAAVVPLVDWM